MPDITQRIADIVSDHKRCDEWGGPDWDCGGANCRSGGNSYEDYAQHVAEVLTTELGLTQEWTWSWPNGSAMGVPGYGFSVPTRDEAVLEADSYMTVVSRYVTDWVPDE